MKKNFKSVFFFFLMFFGWPVFASEMFWDFPSQLTSSESAFPSTAGNGDLGVVLWQEVEKIDEDGGRIWLSMQIYSDGKYEQKIRLFGPFEYIGDVPSISSVAVNEKGIICVAILKSQNELATYSSADKGRTWRETVMTPRNLRAVGPRIHVSANDEFWLFASRTENRNFTLIWSHSDDGINWTPTERFSGVGNLSNSFIPHLVNQGDTDFLFFQSPILVGNRFVYQLYFSKTDDNGSTWTEPVIISDFHLPSETAYTTYHNQRPNAILDDGKLKLVWERTYLNSENSQIYYTELDVNGNKILEPVCISQGYNICSWPEIFKYDDGVFVTWFDTMRNKSAVQIAQQEKEKWSVRTLSNTTASTSFAAPLLCNDDFYVFWIQKNSSGVSCLMRQGQDAYVAAPSFTPLSYKEGVSSAAEKVRIRVNLPHDSSGIAGFSYMWLRSKDELPPENLMCLPDENELELFATDDEAPWFLIVRALDNAGNWSAPSYIEYIRDTTPPLRPIIQMPNLDSKGFTANNSPSFRWQPNPADDDVVGYSYSWSFMGDVPPGFAEGDPSIVESVLSAEFVPPLPPARLITRDKSHYIRNADDGIWAFSVRAIDRLGNIGDAAVIRVFLNKYIPETLVFRIDQTQNRDGSTEIAILGKGFTKNGIVDAIFFDEDGVAPYDYNFSLDQNEFQIDSNTAISKIFPEDMESGVYRVILHHTDRGLYEAPVRLVYENRGNIKHGDFTKKFLPKLQEIFINFFIMIPVPYVLICLLLLLSLISIVFYFQAIIKTIREPQIINKEVYSILKGDYMLGEVKSKTQKLKLNGLSLRWKLSFFVLMILLSVSLGISIPLGFTTLHSQQRTLTKSLIERISVLLESMSSGVRTHLPGQNLLELSILLQETTSIPEVEYATILGIPANGENINIDYVWASNDADIEKHIDSNRLVFGVSRLTGDEITAIAAECLSLNEKAVTSMGELTMEVERLTREGIALATSTDEKSVARRQEIGNTVSTLSARINTALNALGKEGSHSYPELSLKTLSNDNTEFLFYTPVLYRQGGEQNFVRGIVLLQVSTEMLKEELDNVFQSILNITVTITIMALLLGIIGTLLFSTMLIRPLRILSRHVLLIHSTENKSELEGTHLKITSKDEIGFLGNAINDMTTGLVKAAIAAKDLSVGKETQKMFIPLETDATGRKLTTASQVSQYAKFFGYYEGAKGVSGDYFDFRKLDSRHFGIIKCDVAGKGVPASLIMVEIATLFSEYFSAWKLIEDGYDLSPFVSRINDMLTERGFKGRFAAFTLCIFDAVSGDLYFCNAGDSLLHIYDTKSRQKITDSVYETPAAGVFPSFIVDTKGGFPVEKRHLNVGDVLFLYTDGIEEAQRLYRDQKFRVITDANGIDNEQMSPERVTDIIEAVFDKSTYVLEKVNNPIPNEKLEFDFSGCDGTVEDAIMALVSIEKIFRMYKPPKATVRDEVLVDRRVDKFLNAHFKQYDVYCTDRRPHATDSQYLWYTHVMEDPQYDDMTILGVQKR